MPAPFSAVILKETKPNCALLAHCSPRKPPAASEARGLSLLEFFYLRDPCTLGSLKGGGSLTHLTTSGLITNPLRSWPEINSTNDEIRLMSAFKVEDSSKTELFIGNIRGESLIHSQSSLRFLHRSSGSIVNSIWDQLRKNSTWRGICFESHEANTLSGAGDRTDWLPLFSEWFQMGQGQIWCEKTNRVVDPAYLPAAIKTGTMADFLQAVSTFFERFNGRKIGVHLSGGFDSSLVIGLLRHFGISYGLVGMKSDRYEFRTERHVQELLAAGNGDVCLIDESTCLPCSRLGGVPPHQIPDLLSLNYAQDYDMAIACKKLGIEVLLSGGGGDNLLGQAVADDPLECTWRPQTFTDPFPTDISYQAHGIEFLSFFSDLGIVDALYCLRRGQRDDYSKRWARQFFRDFVPRELVEFHYCADFWGRAIDGVISALDNIRLLHREASSLTGSSYFAEAKLEALIAEDLYRPQKELYQRFESRISAAVWVCSIAKSLGFSELKIDRAEEVPDPHLYNDIPLPT